MYSYLLNSSDDGKNQSICYATVGGKVIIYSPHEKYSNNDKQILSAK